MNKLLIISFILLTSFVGNFALSAEWAVIVAPKAIIYADIEMKASIGFIKKGKRVRVGEKARNSGKVVAIIVSKRIAYIRVIDIETSSKKSLVEGRSSRAIKKREATDQKNLIGIGLTSALTTVSFSESPTTDKQYNLFLYGVAMRIHQVGKSSNYGFRGTLGYKAGTREKESFQILNFDLDAYYKLYSSKFLDLNISAGLVLAPFAEYKLGSDFALNGYGGGVQADLEAVLKFEKYALHFSGFYQYQQLLGFKLPDNELFPDSFSPSLASLGVSSFISFYY